MTVCLLGASSVRKTAILHSYISKSGRSCASLTVGVNSPEVEV
jgi:hypothetical protein